MLPQISGGSRSGIGAMQYIFLRSHGWNSNFIPFDGKLRIRRNLIRHQGNARTTGLSVTAGNHK